MYSTYYLLARIDLKYFPSEWLYSFFIQTPRHVQLSAVGRACFGLFCFSVLMVTLGVGRVWYGVNLNDMLHAPPGTCEGPFYLLGSWYRQRTFDFDWKHHVNDYCETNVLSLICFISVASSKRETWTACQDERYPNLTHQSRVTNDTFGDTCHRESHSDSIFRHTAPKLRMMCRTLLPCY